MISYEPLFRTLQEKGITTYALENKFGLNKNLVNRLKHGKGMTTKTLDILCFILDCEVSDILKHVKDE